MFPFTFAGAAAPGAPRTLNRLAVALTPNHAETVVTALAVAKDRLRLGFVARGFEFARSVAATMLTAGIAALTRAIGTDAPYGGGLRLGFLTHRSVLPCVVPEPPPAPSCSHRAAARQWRLRFGVKFRAQRSGRAWTQLTVEPWGYRPSPCRPAPCVDRPASRSARAPC